MKTAKEIVEALAENAPTAELLSNLAPEVQENVKNGWLRILRPEIDSLTPPAPAEPPVIAPLAPVQPPAAS